MGKFKLWRSQNEETKKENSMAMIICPDCNSEMSDQATNCPKCGKPTKRPVGFLLGFGILLLPVIFAWFTLRKGHSTLAKIISFGYLALTIIIALAMPSLEETNSAIPETSYSEEATSDISEPTEQIMEVNIHDILSAYQNNEVGADNKYKGHLVQVTGLIAEVKKDIMDNLYVTLGTGEEFEIPQVQAFFDDSMNNQLGELQKGRQLTVICRIDGLMMNVLAQDCIIK